MRHLGSTLSSALAYRHPGVFMLTALLLHINYQPDNRYQRIYISDEDVQLLRRLAARDVSVGLVGQGLKSYQASVRALLKQCRYNPYRNAWGLPLNSPELLLQPEPHR